MPDIRTEMQKVLQAWDETQTQVETQPQPKEIPMTKAKRPVPARAAFEYAKENPGCMILDIAEHLRGYGIPHATTYSAVKSLITREYAAMDDERRVTTTRESYPTEEEVMQMRKQALIAARAAFSAKRQKEAKRAARLAAKEEAARQAAEQAAAEEEPEESVDRVEEVLQNLNAMEAKELYSRLQEIFG